MVEKVKVAQALYDFESDQPGELSLKCGQYIVVIKAVCITTTLVSYINDSVMLYIGSMWMESSVDVLQVNTEWFEGYSNGKQGIFPQGFVQTFPEVFLPPKSRLFVCIEEFPELQPGDLALQPGML